MTKKKIKYIIDYMINILSGRIIINELKEILIFHKFKPNINFWIGDKFNAIMPHYQETHSEGYAFVSGIFISIWYLRIDITWWHFKLK